MSVFDRIAGAIGRAAAAGCVAGRTLFPFDTNPVPGDWEHVTKVDPEDEKKLPLAYPRYLAHTDGISVGGSADVTETNTVETFRLLSATPTPAFHEPSAASHVTEETLSSAAFLAIPQVLNGDDEAFVGTLGTGTRFIRDELAPAAIEKLLPAAVVDRYGDRLSEFLTTWMLRTAAFEAYVIQNPDSAAAREAGVGRSDLLSPEQARDRAMAAERYLGSEVLYLEYSGTYGGDEAVDILEATAPALSWTRLWYGGGIDSRKKATEILDAGADTVIVGDVFHRIADEETELATAFADDSEIGTSAHADRIDAWLDDDVVADSAAAEYLSTVPSVDDPIAAARENLVAGVAAHCALASAVDDVREAVDDGRIATEGDVDRALRADYRTELETRMTPADARDARGAAELVDEVLVSVCMRAFRAAAAESGPSRTAAGSETSLDGQAAGRTTLPAPVHHLPIAYLAE